MRTETIRRHATSLTAASAALLLSAGLCSADPFFFSTGNPNGLMATASRPGAGGAFEIESADDFVLTNSTTITNATFTGLVVSSGPALPTLEQIVAELTVTAGFEFTVKLPNTPPLQPLESDTVT